MNVWGLGTRTERQLTETSTRHIPCQCQYVACVKSGVSWRFAIAVLRRKCRGLDSKRGAVKTACGHWLEQVKHGLENSEHQGLQDMRRVEEHKSKGTPGGDTWKAWGQQGK